MRALSLLLSVGLAMPTISASAMAVAHATATASGLPYVQPDVTGFEPTPGQYVAQDGDYAAQYCTWLATAFPNMVQGWKIEPDSSFAQYYPAGSNPSLELLVQTYPDSIINSTVANILPEILDDVGPDPDLRRDYAYGKMTPELANNGPTGSLPPFCRYGAFVQTSQLTKTLVEVWLPVQMDNRTPLVPANTSDFPTNTTGVYIDARGRITQAPLIYEIAPGDGTKLLLKANLHNKRTSAHGTTTDLDQTDASMLGVTTDLNQKDTSTLDTTISGARNGLHTSAAQTTVLAGGSTSDSTETGNNGGVEVQGSSKDKISLKRRDSVVRKLSSPSIKGNIQPEAKRGAADALIKGEALLGTGPGWNGRLVQINNGGQRGFVPLSDHKQLMARYGFVVCGSNAGHFSTTGGVKWVVGPQREETIQDWAHRSQLVSTEIGRQLIDVFYGPQSGVRAPLPAAKEDSKDLPSSDNGKAKESIGAGRVRSYLLGVSVGGGSAFGAMQTYGAQWDGALIGAPTIRFSDANFGQLELAKTHRKESAGDAVFNAGVFGNEFHQAVLEQCDELDGVRDGIITNPFGCKVDFVKAIQCGGGGRWSDDTKVCLTELQVANLKKIFSPWQYGGNEIYPGWPIGSEASAKRYDNAAVKSLQWIQLAVQGKLNNDSSFAYSNGSDGQGFTFQDVELGRELNIGNSNFALTDLSGYFSGDCNGGGKIMHYHGLADLQINAVPSIEYFNAVVADQANGGAARVKSNYKLYLVPGMDHGRDGLGAAWHFGGPTQIDSGNRPLSFDTKHDMVLALVAWTEKGLEPTYQIGAGYDSKQTVLPVKGKPKDNERLPTRFESFDRGVRLTRKLCVYPQVPEYRGGSVVGKDAWRSFECV